MQDTTYPQVTLIVLGWPYIVALEASVLLADSSGSLVLKKEGKRREAHVKALSLTLLSGR